MLIFDLKMFIPFVNGVKLPMHFLQFTLFQTKYLEIILCAVSLFIYIWERVEHGQLKIEDIQWNQLQLKQAAGKM